MHTSPLETGKAGITVVPTGGALGAEIRNADLRTIDDRDFAVILGAWHDHSVLLVRGQALNDEHLAAFSKRFGDLDWAPAQDSGRRFVGGDPVVSVVPTVVEKRVPLGSQASG